MVRRKEIVRNSAASDVLEKIRIIKMYLIYGHVENDDYFY